VGVDSQEGGKFGRFFGAVWRDDGFGEGVGALDILDLVWTTGMGNVSGGYFNDGDARNRSDGTYTYLSTLTGKRIVVDTSFGATSMDDSWTGIPAATLNQRIADGVVAVNVTEPPGDYPTRVAGLGPQLSSVCR